MRSYLVSVRSLNLWLNLTSLKSNVDLMRILKNFLAMTTMNLNLENLQKNLSQETDVTKSDGSSKTQLLVRSRCGTLEYLSPLGVLMLIQQSISSLRDIQSTPQKKPSEKLNKVLPKQDGRTAVKPLKVSTPAVVMDVRTKAKSDQTRQSASLPDLSWQSQVLMIPQSQPTQKKKAARLYRKNF